MLLMVGVHTKGMVPTVFVDLGWSLASKEILYYDHLSLGALAVDWTAAILRESCWKWRVEWGA